ncbi:MAG: fibronectin type III domain-containing protein [Boseongicola sp.]|nr:fibronectin type III domain-containing protein [Boseongicola sp.]
MPLQAHIRRALVVTPRAERIIRVSRGSLTVREGETATFDVWLSERPRTGQTVAVQVASTATGEVTVNKSSLTFDENNFGTRQTVTVTGVADADARDENASVTLVATGGGYDDSTAIAVVVEDTTQKRLRVSDPSLAFGSTTLSRTIGVRLSSEPVGGDVTVVISDDSGRFGTDKSSLTFTSANWNIQQIVRVTATAGANATGTLTLDPSGADYGSVASVTVPLAFTLTLPAVPTGLSLTASYTNNNTQQRVRATWNAAARATTYEVRYKKSTETNWTTITGLTSTSYTANGADPNTTYDVQVQSRNASGPSGWSSTVQVTTGRSRGNLYLTGRDGLKIYRMAGGYGNSWDAGINVRTSSNPSASNRLPLSLAFEQGGDMIVGIAAGGTNVIRNIFKFSGGYGGTFDEGITSASNGVPWGMAISNGDLYSINGNKIYRMAGGYGNSWDAGISAPSASFTIPTSIAFDSSRNLYVCMSAETGTHATTIHKMAGGYGNSWDAGISAPSTERSALGIDFDADDDLYLSGNDTNKIFRMTGGYSPTGTWDSGIAPPSGETSLYGIAFD